MKNRMNNMNEVKKYVPFIDGKPSWYDKDVPSDVRSPVIINNRILERKENYSFEASFKIDGFIRGCSSAKMILIDIYDSSKNEVFLKDCVDIIKASDKYYVITACFTFVKRGANWGIKLDYL